MPQRAEQFTISWAGDLLLADAARKHLDRHGHTWPPIRRGRTGQEACG